MIMSYSKILAAYDGSAPSDQALDKAIELVKLLPSTQLEVLHVAKSPNVVLGESYIPASADMRQAVYEEAERILNRARQRLSAASVNGNVQMMEGEPASVIVEFANDRRCDLIVIGSRGLSGLKELVLDSVSHHVVQRSSVPVLIVK